jgi:hypothetical protein
MAMIVSSVTGSDGDTPYGMLDTIRLKATDNLTPTMHATPTTFQCLGEVMGHSRISQCADRVRMPTHARNNVAAENRVNRRV